MTYSNRYIYFTRGFFHYLELFTLYDFGKSGPFLLEFGVCRLIYPMYFIPGIKLSCRLQYVVCQPFAWLPKSYLIRCFFWKLTWLATRWCILYLQWIVSRLHSDWLPSNHQTLICAIDGIYFHNAWYFRTIMPFDSSWQNNLVSWILHGEVVLLHFFGSMNANYDNFFLHIVSSAF
jgi:hypothetical protein